LVESRIGRVWLKPACELEEADWKDKLRLYRTLKFALEREEYLDVVVDAQQRNFLTEMELICPGWK